MLLKPTHDPLVLAHSGVPVVSNGRVERVEERPRRPASHFVVVGAYLFDEALWTLLPGLTPSARGELEVVDVLNHYAAQGLLEHDVLDGFWADAGGSIEHYHRACDFVRQAESAAQVTELVV